jgi:DNA polymerase
VLGRPVTIGRERGRPFHMEDGQLAFVTVHPSFLLRVPDEEARAREYRAFVRDLQEVRRLMA